MMKISFITTVYNEEKSIQAFLASVASQTRKPDEIVIVDGGSTDSTVKLIKRSKLSIRLYIAKGNPSFGRNEAIRHARYEIIAATDAGCRLDRTWLKNITEPFKDKNIDVVSGFYKAKTNSIFEKCLSTYTCVMEDRVNPDKFLPSSRSIAFKKNVWKKSGGYPNALHACEDLIFDLRLKKIGARFTFAKDAIVYWFQKKNLVEAASQFYEYAKGDGQALHVRFPQTPLLYIRYLLLALMLLGYFNSHDSSIFAGLLILSAFYLAWSITKNYKYVKNSKALILLPMLQITSDIATIIGNFVGLFSKRLYLLPILAYSVVIISTIGYGIPNLSHPFNYNMDEWHQSQAVRAVFKHLTPNIPGAANGSVFHFFISGIFLAPFILFKIINPFIITSSLSHLEMQEKVFIVLRLNTLLFGVGSLLGAVLIAKILKINKLISVALFSSIPVWVVLSGIFKYDIALVFWVTISLYSLIAFGKNPTGNKFIISAIPIGLAFATKVSAVPLFLLYFAGYFIFFDRKEWLKNVKFLILGGTLCFAISLFIGLPDLLIRRGDYREYLTSNILGNTEKYSIYNLGLPNWWSYLLLRIFPVVFGHLFYALSIVSILFLVVKVRTKDFMFILLGFIFFAVSLTPLNLGATGNRLLVLLPFLVLFSSMFISNLMKGNKSQRLIVLGLVSIIIATQILESGLFVFTKYMPSVSRTSSEWISKNIKSGTLIGVVNPPIYQTQPDLVLYEFYKKLANPNAKTFYRYVAVSDNDKQFPPIVLISGRELEERYVKKSERRNLIIKLKSQGYKVVAEFDPPGYLKYYFGDALASDLSGLPDRSSVSVFKKD